MGAVGHDSLSRPLTVFVVDDHPVIAEGVSKILSGSGAEVVGYVDDPTVAARRVADLRPDVILLDIMLGDSLGSDAVRPLLDASPSSSILIFTAFPAHPAAAAAVANGASGCVVKDISRVDLVQAMNTVISGATPRAADGGHDRGRRTGRRHPVL